MVIGVQRKLGANQGLLRMLWHVGLLDAEYRIRYPSPRYEQSP